MSEYTCRVCGWSGEADELNRPPTGDDRYYCPECATSIEVD